MPKQTVAVLFGGRSVEHEVSIISAHQAMDALDVAGYPLLPIYITKAGHWYAGKSLYNLKQYSNPAFDPMSLRDSHRVMLVPDPSVRQLVLHPNGGKGFFYKAPMLWADVFFPVLHGAFGEDGCLQGLFETADVPYVGCGVLASAMGMDKVEHKRRFAAAGIPVLPCETVSRRAWKIDPARFIKIVEEKFGWPVIAKPATLGSSIAISRCASSAELTKAIDTAMTYDSTVLVERALENFREVNCSVLGPPNRASVCEMPHTAGLMLTFDDKYRAGQPAKGGKMGRRGGVKGGVKSAGLKGGISAAGMASLNRLIPAPISDDLTATIQDLAVAGFEAIQGYGIARVDFLLDADGHTVYLNEINTMPGSLSYYLWEASGLGFDKLVATLVEGAVERHKQQQATERVMNVNLLAGARG
ncbi:MAG: D-alanine--D-alanine ligase [Bryobacterales bacterium]|nr:D-alanine--D-alanine ligase [Bryobacterales bacterium]